MGAENLAVALEMKAERPPAAAATPHRWTAWWLGAAVVYTVAHFIVSGIITPIRHGHSGDFIAALRDWWDPVVGYYGPFFSWIEWVTHSWERSTVLSVFFGLNSIFLALAWVLSLRVWQAVGWRPSAAVWAWHGVLWLNFYPLYTAIGETNIEMFELMLLSVAFWCWLRARPVAAGVAAGVAAMTKFLPGVVLPYWWIRRERRMCWAMVATMVAICGATMWVRQVTWLQLLTPLQQAPRIGSNFDNQSLQGAVYRCFAHIDWMEAAFLSDPVVWNATAARWIGLGLRGTLLAVAVWWLWRWGRGALSVERQRLRRGVEYMGVLLTVLLVAPHNHTYYFSLILPAYTILLVSWWRWPQLWSRPLRWCAVTSYLFLAYVIPLSLLDRVLPPVATVPYIHVFKLLSLPFGGACLLWLALGGLYRRLAMLGEGAS